MDEEGLGRGIEDISHFFLSARERRRGREDRPGIDPSGTDPPGTASPAGTPGSAEPGRQEEPERRPIVWPVVRVGEADSQPERTWRMAWRLAPAGTHVIHLRVSAESTEVRWLGQAEHPPAGQTAVELIDPADVAVIDLTEASRALQEQVALAAGRLVVVTGSSDTDCVAAYSFIKEARDPLGEVTIGLEVEGPEEASAAAFTRVRDAVGYFLKRPLVDWRDRYPLPESAAPGPEPTLAARAPTETIQGVLCGLAARSRAREVEEVPSPAASPGPPPSREETTATPAQPSPTEEGPSPGGGAVLPLLTWTCPSPSELADFLESHPHLLQPDLLVLDRGAATVQEAYQERSRRAGDDPDAHLALAQECLDGDLLPQAEAELRLVLKLRPKHLAATLKLADLYAAQGKLDAEVGVYRAALAAGLDAAEIHRRLGRRCLELGLFETAARHFARALALVGKCSVEDVVGGEAAVPEDAEAFALLRRVAECWLLARRRGAEELIARLLAARSDDPPTRNLRALADILAGRTDRARQTLLWLARGPNPPASARNNLGALLLASGDIEGALAEFEACLAAAPHHFKALANLALAHAAAGRLAEAEKALSRLASLEPPPSLGHLLVVAYVRELQGRQAEAQAAYSEALGLDGCSRAALLGAARCLLASKKPGPAEEKVRAALVLEPGDRRALRLLVACLAAAGRFREAAAAVEKLAGEKAEPADLVRAALTHVRLPDGAARAEKLLARAARLAPDDPYLLAARAWLEASKGDDQAAERLLIQASGRKCDDALRGYLADALAALRGARGEVAALVRFEAGKPPEGWALAGSGEPKLEVVGGALKLEGRADGRIRWELATTVAASRQGEDGGQLSLARLAARVAAPLANQATVGLRMGFGNVAFEVALRTEHEPRFSRRLAYRIVRGGAASPWVDLPVTVATEEFRLGLGLSAGEGPALEARLDGKPVGEPVPLKELAKPPGQLAVGVFVEAEPGSECFVVVRRLELVWRKTVVQPEGPFK